jgi:hypothetical protein
MTIKSWFAYDNILIIFLAHSIQDNLVIPC